MIAPTANIQAGNIDNATAKQVAAYFMAAQTGNKGISSDNVKLVYEIPNALSHETALYVFNTPGRSGFVVVAGSDCVNPIVAYSTDGDFDPTDIAPAMQWWLNEQVQVIAYAQNNDLNPTPDMQKAWDQLTKEELPYFGVDSKAITRLLNSKWNQEPLYNKYCPDVDGVLCPVGCVATAMAQIIYFWKFPWVGKGTNTYNWNAQALSADFAHTYYDYNLMVDALTESSPEATINAVALLSYHCGIAVNMNYGVDGSGSNDDKALKAFRKFFKYDANSMQLLERYNNSLYHNPNNTTTANSKDTAWVNRIAEEILAGRPVYYAGYSPEGGSVHAGHAFVCDGYNDVTKTLHFNWGWGGRGDCWCNVFNSNLNVPFMGLNFTQYHSAIVGLTPPADSLSNPIAVPTVEDPFTCSIYPNPANDHITISYALTNGNSAVMQIFDITGRKVDEVALSPYASQTTINVANYQPGIYFCRLNGISKKFVVQ